MKETKDPLGDRMKVHERYYTSVHLNPDYPVYARLDGRGFSRFTRNLTRPFDSRMSEVMVRVTERLIEEFSADVGYTQSDEISLGWLPRSTPGYQLPFGGKLQKLCSVAAGVCSVEFHHRYLGSIGVPKTLPAFDARFVGLPSVEELKSMFAWRQADARRNAVGMAAHHELGHSKLIGVSTKDRCELLVAAGVDFGLYPPAFREGTFVHREVHEFELTEEQLARIPESKRPTGPVPRNVFLRSHTFPLTLP